MIGFIEAYLERTVKVILYSLLGLLLAGGGTWYALDKKDEKKEERTESVKPVSGSVVLHYVKADPREFYIQFDYTDNSHWPEKEDVAGKPPLKGYIFVNGERVEQFREGYKSQHLKNVYGGEPYKVPGIKTGDKVRIQLQSRDFKEKTNEVEFIWPWKNT